MVKLLIKKSSKSLKRQLDELIQNSDSKQKKNWDKYFGKVQFSDEPVIYQRALRNE